MPNIFKDTGKFRFRTVFIILGSFLALVFLLGTSPEAGLIKLPFGAEVIAKLPGLAAGVFGVGILYFSRKALFDYIDMGELAKKAVESPVGAGLVFVGICLTMVAIALIVMAMVATFT